MKVGITGAGGNVGTTITRGLKDDYDLALYDLNPIAGTDLPAVCLDCAEPDQLKGQLDGLDALIHLAGNPWPNVPAEVTLRNNFAATSYVFDEAYRAGVKKIVFSSSNFYHQGAVGDMLGGKRRNRITLDEFPTPQCMYAQSKVYAESLGRHLAYLGMQFVALRIGWTVREDSPVMYDGPYMRGIFISHRDLVQAMRRALEVDGTFVAAFAVSNNSHGLFDLDETRAVLGYDPQDDADAYFTRSARK
jgi:NAD+ dependent glucose-6-phosphate dehydrogenase